MNVLGLVHQALSAQAAGPYSRKKIKASAHGLWKKLDRKAKRRLVIELRSEGFPGKSDWNIFLNFVLSEFPHFEAAPRNPANFSAGEVLDREELGRTLLRNANAHVQNASRGTDLLKDGSRAQLLDLVVPFWRGLTTKEREVLNTQMHAIGLTDNSLVENLVAYAGQLAQHHAQGAEKPSGRLPYLWGHIRAGIARGTNFRSRGNSGSVQVGHRMRVPTGDLGSPLERGVTGNGRPAPHCQYCGGNTRLGATYHYCAAVEIATEEWFCARPGCVGTTNPTKFRYPVRDYERRG